MTCSEVDARFREVWVEMIQIARSVRVLESAMSKPHTVLAPATRTSPSFELPNDVATPAPAAEQQDITADVIAHPERWQTRDGRKVISARLERDQVAFPLIVDVEGESTGTRTISGHLFFSRSQSSADIIPIDPPADVVRREDVRQTINGLHKADDDPIRTRAICDCEYEVRVAVPSASSPAPDVRAEAEMEMWKRCREAVRQTPVADLPGIGCIPAASRCLAAIDALKPTAPAGTGGEGGKQ